MRAQPEMLAQRLLPRELFKGKTVFVTGGGSGINLGVAKNFAALGARVAICGRTQAKLDAAADELRALGAQVCAVAADVREIAALDAALERSREELGPVDVLVCGAAGNFLVPAERLSANGFKTVIDIDLLGAFNSARAAFEQLRRTRRLRDFHLRGHGLHAARVSGSCRRGQGRHRHADEESGYRVGPIRHSLQFDRSRTDRGYRGNEAALGAGSARPVRR